MPRFLRAAVIVLAVATLAGCSGRSALGDSIGMRDYSVDPSTHYQPFDFQRLINTPQQGLDVAFVAMFDRHDERIWQPFYSSFTPEEFVSFSAWPPAARVWEIEGRQSSVPTLYFRKGGPHLDQLMGVKRYQLIEIRGTIRTTFEGRPWIEVFYVLPRTGSPIYSDKALRSLYRGITEADTDPACSIKCLTEAIDSGELHNVAVSAGYAKLGDVYARMATGNREHWATARDHYDDAMSYDANNRHAHEGYDTAVKHWEAYQSWLQLMEEKRAAARAAAEEAGRPYVEPSPEPMPEPSPEPTPTEEPQPSDPQPMDPQ